MSLWCIPSTETILGYPHPSTSSANHAACILTFSLSLSVRSLSTLWWLNACLNGKRSPLLCQLLSASFVLPSLSVLLVTRLSECMRARRGNKTPYRHREGMERSVPTTGFTCNYLHDFHCSIMWWLKRIYVPHRGHSEALCDEAVNRANILHCMPQHDLHLLQVIGHCCHGNGLLPEQSFSRWGGQWLTA